MIFLKSFTTNIMIYNIKLNNFTDIYFKRLMQSNTEFENIPIERIRNFSIVAHVDHGKSTLADRILELTGAIRKSPNNKQVLDSLDLERSRGITIKAKTASMFYRNNNNSYLFNLIDTPGHVDFSFEVSRSLTACEGVILLVDASKGVQAQTLSHYNAVRTVNISIIPVINKIDIKSADINESLEQICTILKFNESEVLKISAKTGEGVPMLLDEIIARIPQPIIKENIFGLRALLFDSYFDSTRGVICVIAVKSGSIKTGDIVFFSNEPEKTYRVREVGIFRPVRFKTDILLIGYVGYVILGIKTTNCINIGSLVLNAESVCSKNFESFQKPQNTVYACVYSTSIEDIPELRFSIQKLALNDSSVTVLGSFSEALGQGFKIGFLGQLHLEIFFQRLKNEHKQNFVITSPTITYKAILKNKSEIYFDCPSKFPERFFVESYLEPFIECSIISPEKYMKAITDICILKRGELDDCRKVSDDFAIYIFWMPLNQIITDFTSKIKNLSHGYASITHGATEYRPSKIIKLDVLINDKPFPTFCQIVYQDEVIKVANQSLSKISSLIPLHTFEIDIKFLVTGKVIARRKIKPNLDDPTRKCYGGDITRKMKLWSKQAKHQKELKKTGYVRIPHEVYCKYFNTFDLD